MIILMVQTIFRVGNNFFFQICDVSQVAKGYKYIYSSLEILKI